MGQQYNGAVLVGKVQFWWVNNKMMQFWWVRCSFDGSVKKVVNIWWMFKLLMWDGCTNFDSTSSRSLISWPKELKTYWQARIKRLLVVRERELRSFHPETQYTLLGSSRRHLSVGADFFLEICQCTQMELNYRICRNIAVKLTNTESHFELLRRRT